VRTALRKREEKKESIEFVVVSENLSLTREEADWIRGLSGGEGA
jgi:hypothetical protein